MQVLSQAKAKQIRALHQKKVRQAEGLFLVEGAKSVVETLKSDWKVNFLVATPRFITENTRFLEEAEFPVYQADADDLGKISHFQTNDSALAVVHQHPVGQSPHSKNTLWLALEGISDPGNLGSIIRLADWYGLDEIICLGDCVEWYNPKVIAGSMGSFLRIKQVVMDWNQLRSASDRTLLSADMNGESLFNHPFDYQSILLIGNEANGLSNEVLKSSNHRISIPSFGAAESLNAAMATGIILNQWRFRLAGK